MTNCEIASPLAINTPASCNMKFTTLLHEVITFATIHLKITTFYETAEPVKYLVCQFPQYIIFLSENKTIKMQLLELKDI